MTPSEPDLLSGPALSTLHEGRMAHLAIVTARGPHVTPELYAIAGGRLWFFVATTTLKAKRMHSSGKCGALVRTGAGAVMLAGRVERLDPLAPHDLLTAVPAFPHVPAAVAGFAARNAADLLGFARDTVAGRTGRFPPPRRILLSVLPERIAVLDDDEVVEASGDWRATEPRDPRRDPTSVEPAPGSTIAAVAGWPGPDGPLALPVHWSPEEKRAAVPRSLFVLSGALTSGPASVVADDYGRPGPAGKSGVLLRGEGRADLDGDDGWVWLHVNADRVTAWDGIETDTAVVR